MIGSPKSPTRRSPAPGNPVMAEVLAPLSCADFLERHWGRNSVALQDRPGIRPIFRIADVDRYLRVAASDPSAQVSVSSAGGPVRNAALREVAAGDLQRAFLSGATLMFPSIERNWPAAAELAAGFAALFGADVKINVYLTPPGRQGAPLHPDIQDVFAFQMEGRKHWFLYRDRVYEPVETLEHREIVPRPAISEEDAVVDRELDLAPGDLLYLPRGLVHRAVADPDHPSLHLAICVSPPFWVDLLKAALERFSAEVAETGEVLPPDFAGAGREDLRERFRSLVARFAEEAAFDHAVDLLDRARRRRWSPPPDGHFAQLAGLESMTGDSVVERRLGVDCEVVAGSEGVELRSVAGSLRGPEGLAPALRFIAAELRFRVGDLPAMASDESRLVLVRRLVRDGLLRVVDGASA